MLVYHRARKPSSFLGLADALVGLSSSLVVFWSSFLIWSIIHIFLNVCPFDEIAFVVSGKVEIP